MEYPQEMELHSANDYQPMFFEHDMPLAKSLSLKSLSIRKTKKPAISGGHRVN